MLNPFPELLTYSILAPTLLRAAAALVFAYVAYTQWRRRKELAATQFFLVGSGAWIIWTLIVLEVLSAVGLFLGYNTQWAAILGAALALKFTVWGRRYGKVFSLSRTTNILLLVVCLSLIVSGAGAMAFDLRL